MPFSHNTFIKAAVMAAALASAVILVGCGSDDTRDAASVSTSTSGTIVTDTSTDLGSIVIGWGEQHSDSEITTPKPEDVTARCTGRGEDLAVDITAPHHQSHAALGSQGRVAMSVCYGRNRSPQWSRASSMNALSNE